MDIPLGLKTALESGECVLFIGAGIGSHLIDPNGDTSPDGKTLAEELVGQFNIEVEDEIDLSRIAEIVEIRKGRPELEAFLRKRFAKLEPDESFRWLFSMRWKAIFTTNFDYGIERAYELNGSPKQKPISISTTSAIVPYDPRFEVPIYHLHGCLFGSDKPRNLITEDDYVSFSENRRMLFELLKNQFASSSILYIGYSNKDFNWRIVFNELLKEFFPSTPQHSYRIAPRTDPIDKEILYSKGVETIECTLHEFVQVALTQLSDIQDDKDRLQRLKSLTPSELIPAFDKNPAGVARLLSSWLYVT